MSSRQASSGRNTSDPVSTSPARINPAVAVLGVVAGAMLLVIGIRFVVVPDAALKTFGLSIPATDHALHHVVGLRDIWLAALALAFVGLRLWRALALWLLLAVPVCWGDAVIVWRGAGPGWAIAFHAASGVFCLVLGLAAWRSTGAAADQARGGEASGPVAGPPA